jgi:large subunit ribosomal protein L10
MSKDLKLLINRHLERKIGSLQSYIVVDYKGLNSAQSSNLRRVLNESGVRMNVVPNRLAARILDRWEGKKADFRKFFRGPTALLFGNDGAITASKVIAQWKRKNKDLLAIKGGVLEGEVILAAMVEGLSRIPERPVLLAQVAGGMQAPLSRLASATQAILSKVVYALEARRKKLEESGGGAEATPEAGPEAAPEAAPEAGPEAAPEASADAGGPAAGSAPPPVA